MELWLKSMHSFKDVGNAVKFVKDNFNLQEKEPTTKFHILEEVVELKLKLFLKKLRNLL
jgi:hypothetical protein